MTLQKAADSLAWAAAAVHDSTAKIAGQPAYGRSVGESAMQRIFSWLGRILTAVADLMRGSSTGRHVATAIAIVIVVAIAIHVVLASLAARSEIVSAGAHPARARTADAWRDAQRLAAAGQFTDASHALLAALLWTFAQRGEVRLHSSKTAGDYARELAQTGSPARAPFGQFRRRYDAVIFGVGECSADEYTALLRDAEPMLARPVVA